MRSATGTKRFHDDETGRSGTCFAARGFSRASDAVREDVREAAQSARRSLSAFAITITDAPVSARIAIQSVATPAIAATMNAAFITTEIARFILMLRTVAPAETKRVGDLQQLVGHQRNVRRLERGVAAGGSHRIPTSADASAGRVVHPVTHHRQRSRTAAYSSLTAVSLSSGSSSARNSNDAELFGNRFRGTVAVAGEHHD